MPTSIPYDEGLVLGQLIDRKKVENLKTLADAQNNIDLAEANFNLLIQAKRSMEMTRDELNAEGGDTSELNPAINELESATKEAALNLARVKINAYGPEGAIRNLALERIPTMGSGPEGSASAGGVGEAAEKVGGMIDYSFESPIDFDKSIIRKLPLASDTISLDCQYFARDSNEQNSDSFLGAVKSFVGVSTKVFGVKQSTKIMAAASAQVSSQIQLHDVVGTLVISAVCTHESAKIMDPLVLDGDKAVRSWNAMHKDDKDQIVANSVKEMQGVVLEKEPDNKYIDVLTGMSTGSSFVGMVHVLRTESTSSSQNMHSVSSQIQYEAKAGGWFASTQGAFGIDASFARDTKRLLSSLEVTSHCTITCMGCIPTIKSNEISLAVKEFGEFDPAKIMEKLTVMANYTAKEKSSLDANAEAARRGNQMMAMHQNDIHSMLTGLGEIDDGKNKILDINTMVTAFEDYVEKAMGGESGVPINFYISSFKKFDIIKAWMVQYFPDQLEAVMNPPVTVTVGEDGEATEDEAAGDSPAATGEVGNSA